MKKCFLAEEEVYEVMQQIYHLLYIDSSKVHEEIAFLARTNAFLESTTKILVLVDETPLPNDLALFATGYCESFDVNGISKAIFVQELCKNTNLPLVCDMDFRLYEIAKLSEFSRKLIFIVHPFALDRVLTRAELFSLNPKYYADIKRSDLKEMMLGLDLHPSLYERSQGTSLYAIMHDFYFNSNSQWSMAANQAASIQTIKSFLTESSIYNDSFADLHTLEKDLEIVNFDLRKRIKSNYTVQVKNIDLCQEMAHHFTVFRSFQKVFTYLDLCYFNLEARLFIVDALSSCVERNASELEMVERVVRAASELRTVIPAGKISISDTFVEESTNEEYWAPEAFELLWPETQIGVFNGDAIDDEEMRDSSISD